MKAAPMIVVTGPSGAGKTTVARLVATAFDPSAHVRTEAFWPFVVNGWVEPWRPEAGHQNDVLGGTVAMAATAFALGGYTVVVDGHFFPEGLDGLAQISSRRGVSLHCAVLRADLATCLARVRQRSPDDAGDPELLARLHARFADLGRYEANVIDASGSPEDVAAELLSAFTAGRLVSAVKPAGAGPGATGGSLPAEGQ